MQAVADNGRWTGPRLRFLPIVLVLAIGMGIIYLAFFLAGLMQHAFGSAAWPDWLHITIAEAFELLFALIGIAVAGRFLRSADFGLRWPPGRTYIGWAAFWGLAFALIMLVADHWPQLIHLRPPPTPEAPTPANRNGSQADDPTCCRLNPRASWK